MKSIRSELREHIVKFSNDEGKRQFTDDEMSGIMLSLDQHIGTMTDILKETDGENQ